MSEERIEQVHFIGVGGVGMSGIARVAFDQDAGERLDIKESRYTKQLKDAGITVFAGHGASNIPAGDPGRRIDGHPREQPRADRRQRARP